MKTMVITSSAMHDLVLNPHNRWGVAWLTFCYKVRHGTGQQALQAVKDFWKEHWGRDVANSVIAATTPEEALNRLLDNLALPSAADELLKPLLRELLLEASNNAKQQAEALKAEAARLQELLPAH